NKPHGRDHGEPVAWRHARRVRRAAWGNGPAAMPAPRPGRLIQVALGQSNWRVSSLSVVRDGLDDPVGEAQPRDDDHEESPRVSWLLHPKSLLRKMSPRTHNRLMNHARNKNKYNSNR